MTPRAISQISAFDDRFAISNRRFDDRFAISNRRFAKNYRFTNITPLITVKVFDALDVLYANCTSKALLVVVSSVVVVVPVVPSCDITAADVVMYIFPSAIAVPVAPMVRIVIMPSAIKCALLIAANATKAGVTITVAP